MPPTTLFHSQQEVEPLTAQRNLIKTLFINHGTVRVLLISNYINCYEICACFLSSARGANRGHRQFYIIIKLRFILI